MPPMSDDCGCFVLGPLVCLSTNITFPITCFIQGTVFAFGINIDLGCVSWNDPVRGHDVSQTPACSLLHLFLVLNIQADKTISFVVKTCGYVIVTGAFFVGHLLCVISGTCHFSAKKNNN